MLFYDGSYYKGNWVKGFFEDEEKAEYEDLIEDVKPPRDEKAGGGLSYLMGI